VHYTAWCDDEGFVLDDGTLFRLSADRFRLCCQERHLPWLLDSAVGFEVSVEEETEQVAGLALQGPTSFAVLREAGFAGVEKLKVFDLAEFDHEGGKVVISRTGFTGDLGYELFVDRDLALSLWDRLFKAGELRGIRAIGYTALNRARTEAGLIVANADFVTSEHAIRANRLRLPDEIGLGFMVDATKGHFNGRRAILEARARGKLRHVLVGLEIEGNVPAEHAIVYHKKHKEVGLVSAALWSPMAKKNIALASLERPFGDTVTDDLWVEIYAMRELQYQKLMKRAKVVQRPFIKLDRRTANPPADF
jgi:aminomethyltransferase